jgi:hypothetical protein
MAGGFAVIGTAASASAASCSGYSCHGHDPNVYGCSVSSTASAPANFNGTQVATVYNRYSQNCNANWGRGQLTQAGLNAHDSIIVDVFTTDSHGTHEYMCYPGPNNTGALTENCSGATYGGSAAIFSDMVDGTNTATADVYVYNSSGTFITSASASQ